MLNGRHRGVTLADVIAISVIVPLVLGALIPAMATHSREPSGRVKCASNLRQLGLAIQMYANENKGAFPRTFFNPDSSTIITSNQGWDAPVPFSPDGPSPVGDNNVAASFFLLMRTQDLTSEVFICPQSAGERDTFHNNPQGAMGQSNFSDISANLSYSYVVPFPTNAARNKGFELNFTLTSDFAIAADMNPGGQQLVGSRPTAPRAQMATYNSNNHNGDGENVLYADGHVEFQNTPFCGMKRSTGYLDNIYTAGGADTGTVEAVIGQPADNLDSILLPVDPAGPGQRRVAAAEFGGTATWLGIAALVMIGVVAMIVVMVKRASVPMAEQAPPMPPAA